MTDGEGVKTSWKDSDAHRGTRGFECDILMMQGLRKAVKLQKTELYRAMKLQDCRSYGVAK